MSDTRVIKVVAVQPVPRPGSIKDQLSLYEQQLKPVLGRSHDSEPTPTLVVLPEYALGNALRGVGTKEDIKPAFDWAAGFAKDHGIVLVGGSLAVEEGGRWFNRTHVWDPLGKVVGWYDKQHLFQDEQTRGLVPGQVEGIVEVPKVGRIQLLVCSDLWHPEHLRSQLAYPVHLVVVPTLSVVDAQELTDYGRWLWHSLAITRSRENVTPVVVADWTAGPMGQIWTSGGSSVVDPSVRWTSPDEARQAFARLDDGRTGVVVGRIDLGQVAEYRRYRQQAGLLPQLGNDL